jgi:thiol-disulfide isomerase/thioredoxin
MLKSLFLSLILVSSCLSLFSQRVDAILQQVHVGRYYQVGTQMPLSIGVRPAANNTGSVTQVKVRWSFDKVATGELSAQGFNIPSEWSVAAYPVRFTESIPVPEKGRYNFTVSIIELNGRAVDPIDTKTMSYSIQVMDSLTQKKVLIEEFTGTWCVWCPRGMEVVEKMVDAYGKDKIHPVMLHIGDPMEIPVNDEIGKSFPVRGYPSGSMSRLAIERTGQLAYGTNDFEAGVFANVNAYTPITVSFEQKFNPQTRQLTLNAKATSTNTLSGIFKVNYYIIEDSVTGGPEYDQANNLHFDPSSKWYQKGNPMVGFVHHHVLRHALIGANGVRIARNSQIVKDQVYELPTERYTIPAGLKLKDLKIICFAYNDEANSFRKEVLDVVEEPLKLTVGNPSDAVSAANAAQLSVYPNPADESIQIETYTPNAGAYAVRLKDINGKIIDTYQFQASGAGESQVVYYNSSELPVGVYMLSVEGPNAATQYAKVLISR